MSPQERHKPEFMLFLPIVLFVLTLQDAFASRVLGFPGGTFTTLIELLISAVMYVEMSRTIAPLGIVRLIPVCIALGDFFYGLSNYTLQLPFPNQLLCLTYVIPYLTALSLFIRLLFRGVKDYANSQRRIIPIGLTVSALILVLTTINIVVPALFHKDPPLSLLMKTLTVLFSALESVVIGGSITLLLVSTRRSFQTALFGIFVMHVSDLAIRFQSVRTELIGMTIFENGWCLGLALMGVATHMFRVEQQQMRPVENWLPLSSIRGITIGFIFMGFTVLWLGLSIYYKTIGSASAVSGSLLVMSFAFAFSVLIADILTQQIQRIINSIEKREDFEDALAQSFASHEIKVITRHFDRLNRDIEFEKNRVLSMTSCVSHDLRGPLRAMLRVLPMIREDVGADCGCFERVMPALDTVDASARLMEKTTDELLRNRKSTDEGETIQDAVRDALSLSKLTHSHQNIEVQLPEAIPPLKLHGLTRVLNNLISNAVEASPSGTPVQVLVREDRHGYDLIVKDKGTGIPSDIIAAVENGQSITTKPDGNGIGLPFVISWAKKNDVQHRIVSRLGEGTEVALSIRVN